ncbi:NERD domain-containing protein [Allorhizocola rhizosphaerae]|uniref:NERD domain-containing protein n=1 Tax=Allorhizocola rhizosphaerae TaxID=1872709 RepID=UPI0014795A75|nr:NERD domain-containing protein [Allorhizocola rhizosphaerae]
MTTYPYRPQFGEPLRLPATQWARRIREEQLVRRMAAAEERAAHRLGAEWHVIEWPNLRPPITAGKTMPLPGFLAIGPGGLFSVSIAQHGRSRVLIAGDVVQINGKRPSYVNQARRDARQVAKAISGAIGQEIKVFPVLAFVGNGTISVNGLPKDCVVTTYRELDKVLAATGRRITPSTADKLSQVARNPGIWGDASGYRWYAEGTTPGDKGTTRG